MINLTGSGRSNGSSAAIIFARVLRTAKFPRISMSLDEWVYQEVEPFSTTIWERNSIIGMYVKESCEKRFIGDS